MKKTPVTMQLDDKTLAGLDAVAEATGYQTRNLLMTQLAVIVAAIPPDEYLTRLALLKSPPPRLAKRAEIVAA